MTAFTSQPWGFHNPVQTRFGAGARAALVDRLQGQRLLMVTTARGRKQFESDPLLGGLAAGSIWVDSVAPNPGLTDTQREIDRLAGQAFDAVIAFGGGSAMDAAKALAAALAPDAIIRDLASLISKPEAYLSASVLPIYAVTTTSGTGAEVTPFATIWDHENRKKLSLASPYLFARMAIVDPELTYGLPLEATLATGFDALNQAFESVWNRNRSPVTLMMASRAIALSFEALPKLLDDLDDKTARGQIAEASLLAGLCISQTRTAICHSMSYPITAHFGLSHGFACAFTMGRVAERVLQAAPAPLVQVAELAGFASAEDLVARLRNLLDRAEIGKRAWAAIPSAAQLSALAAEMHTPGRADNFILPVDQAFIAELIASL